MQSKEFKAKYPNRFDYQNQTDGTVRVVGFGVLDAKGREIGAVVQTWEIECIPAGDADEHGRTARPVGRYFVAVVQSARGNESFGASRRHEFFTTEEKRAAFIARRLRDSEKAAAKKAAKGNP